MNIQEAMKEFSITSLDEETKETLKKRYRKLAKSYHPDLSKGDKDKFEVISEAYQLLQGNIDKKVSNNDWFSFRQQKQKKVISFNTFLSLLNIKKREINKFDEDYFLFIDLKFKIIISDETGIKNEKEELITVRYNNKNEYYVDFHCDYKLNDTIKIYIDNDLLLDYLLEKKHFMIISTKKITVLDTMKFMITISQN